eukprot:2883468-Pleurochrysis_carterae.AAC.2
MSEMRVWQPTRTATFSQRHAARMLNLCTNLWTTSWVDVPDEAERVEYGYKRVLFAKYLHAKRSDCNRQLSSLEL